MPLKPLTGARFNMSATLLHQNDDYNPLPVDPTDYGDWVDSQDPLTGQIIKVWTPFTDQPDNPDTPETDPTFGQIKCLARGIVDGGIRVAGTTERFGDMYTNIDYVKMWVPRNFTITKRDRITNIATPDGRIRWKDEEFADAQHPETAKATLFNVNGVTPLYDAFNHLVEWFVLLERAELPNA